MMVLREKRRSVTKKAFANDRRGYLFRSKYNLLRQQYHKVQCFKRWNITTIEIFNDNTDFTVIMNR